MVRFLDADAACVDVGGVGYRVLLPVPDLARFERLIAIQGVGPKTALALLSGIDGADLVRAIGEKDEARLTKIPGVGKKTAARIILELADKMAKEALASPSKRGGAAALRRR